MTLIFCFFAILYGYFFQGGGWNQNSQFDTVRAIVERGAMDVTAYAHNTGDVGAVDGRIYANKPPGLAFMAAPFYFVIYHLERHFGFSPGAFWTVNINAQLLTFFVSGLPAVILLLLLYRHFRRRVATVHESLLLASAFGTGTLLLPFSGVMMNHLLAACLLFAAWHILTAADLPWRMALLAGLLAGFAVLTESLAAPASALFLFYAVRKRAPAVFPFLIGSCVMAVILLAHNYFSLGGLLIGNNSIQSETFNGRGLLFGMLGWPKPVRLYWLLIHPYRGLFCCCPVLVLSLLSLRRPVVLRQISLETAVPLLVVGYHLLFNMSFNGWTGGWTVGPRYLIPSMPFLYSFALDGFRRFPAISRVLIVVSAAMMLCVAAVQVSVPSPNDGPPPFSFPVLDSIGHLAAGEVSITTQGMLDHAPSLSPGEQWDSYNLGELLGLRGPLSLAPIAFAFAVFAFLARRTARDTRLENGPKSLFHISANF